MEAHKKAKVRVVSSEVVKPSSPTPLDKQRFTLSFLDQSFPTIHTPLLLVYSNRLITQPTNTIISTLKSSLSETLSIFYPLAGRCEDESTISCFDQGVPFNETRVNCNLNDVLNSSNKLKMLRKLLPPMDLFTVRQKHISELTPLSFQVNVFECGGIVIGCSMLHKLLDATSMTCFLKYWAGLTSKRYDDLVKPEFDTTLETFPSSSAIPQPLWKPKILDLIKFVYRIIGIKVVCRSFVFSDEAIEKLKGMAANDVLPNPTRFETVAGFVWQQIMAASNMLPKPTRFETVARFVRQHIMAASPAAAAAPAPATLLFAANIRPRTTPPLPKQSMGNLFIDVLARSDKCNNNELSDHVKEIHAAISNVRDKIEILVSEDGATAYRARMEFIIKSFFKDSRVSSYTLTSWCKLGFKEVDFGFGKPDKVIPVSLIHRLSRNLIIVLDYCDDSNGDNGIEVWLFLEEKEMQILESSTQFSAFASPS